MSYISYELYYKGMNILIKYGTFEYSDLSLDIVTVRNYCREGCPNYNNNGGCPPFSPTAGVLLKDKRFVLIMGRIKTRDFSEEQYKNADKILNELLNEIGGYFKKKYSLMFLSPSHCTECEICTIHRGCQKPDKRTISITGTGILLSEILEKMFDEKLEWYNDNVPEKLVKIMCIISDEMSEIVQDVIKNYKQV